MVDYRCMFYESRICHVREQLGIKDKDLNELFTEKTEEGFWQNKDAPTRAQQTNRAYWLTDNFCRICPHLKSKA